MQRPAILETKRRANIKIKGQIHADLLVCYHVIYLLHIYCPKKYVNQEQLFPRVYKNLQEHLFRRIAIHLMTK